LPRLGVITGLVREARCLDIFPSEERPRTAVSGARPGRAQEAAQALLDQGCDALMSFGICGGLDPRLVPGTVVLADRVIAEDGEVTATDARWLAALSAAAAGRCAAVVAPVFGTAKIIASRAAKKELFQKTGAAAVDMESHEVAAVARERGVPFIAVRAVSDSARRTVPRAARYGIREDGTTRPAAVCAAVLIRPWEAFAIVGLGWDAYAALSGLRCIALLGDPLFALG
jgi:adenosylhomocysteine nucleosidase